MRSFGHPAEAGRPKDDIKEETLPGEGNAGLGRSFAPPGAGLRMTEARPWPSFSHILPTSDSRRAMRFSIGGWVVKSDVRPPPPENGLAIIMWAVVGWAVCIGMRWV